VERFASEVPDEYLVNHGWGRIPCHAVLSKIEARLKIKNTWQGRKYEMQHD
jgi:radical SAM superfamily enzyme